ncbi:hypothetical protein [Pseudomonas sp. 11/12A]|jgi:hypothetical protein|uniref:hypothetical protein n=1 Tax=Pseudomonas sp. 11/12A TaxID=1506582 RepID=UPI000647B301|nr:hypothetical protein [Pseudomonas sp. 11/12A]
MFRTVDTEIAGFPGMFGDGLAHWHSVSRVLNTHWYHVAVKTRHEDRFADTVEFLNDETRLHELISSQNEDFVITEVQVQTPPWMNGGQSWRMEKLNAVSIGYDPNSVVICLLEVESGVVYTDAHDSSFDAQSLTNVKKIY